MNKSRFTIIVLLAILFIAGFLIWGEAEMTIYPAEEEPLAADSESPVSGICAQPPSEDIVTVSVNEDTPEPRCQKVLKNQSLSVKNNTLKKEELWFGDKEIAITIEPESNYIYKEKFGDYLSPGVHDLHGDPFTGPEIWLITEADIEMDDARMFLIVFLDHYSNLEETKNFEGMRRLLARSELEYMISENIPLETNYTGFDSYEIVSFKKLENGFEAEVRLSSDGEILKSQNGDIFNIIVVKEDGEFRSKNWYFIPNL